MTARELVRRGAGVGCLAGAVMGLMWMAELALFGQGFWQPLNLLAHALWRTAPLGGGFDLPAAVLGAVIGFAVSAAVGVVGTFALSATAGNRWGAIPGGVLFGVFVWVISQGVI